MTKLKMFRVRPLPKGYGGYPFREGDVVLMLGEIDKMPGHCAVATQAGKVIMGFDMDNFEEIPEEDL